MYLSDVRLRNFRVYEGFHHLSLVAPDERNVYLVGGLNGAGKTSLFSAVVLGLYGQDAAGLIFERRPGDDLTRVYKRYLEESFSFGARAQGEAEMSVCLTLSHQGDAIRIQRSWWFTDGQLEDESLVVYRNQHPLSIDVEDVDERERILQEFIEGLAPARVAKFFFFDGEEIRSIADRDPDRSVVDGLNQLLGFHTLSRVVDDLGTLRNNIRRELPRAVEAGLPSAVSEVEAVQTNLSTTTRSLDERRNQLDQNRMQLDETEEQIRSLFGGAQVRSRNEALDALAERERELAALSGEIQSFVAEVLALSLPGQLFERTVRRARKEARGRRAREARERLRDLKDELSSALFGRGSPRVDPPLTKDQKAALRDRLSQTWAQHVESGDESTRESFAHFSVEELERLPETLEVITATARRELLARLARRAHLEAQIQSLRSVQGLFDTGTRAQALLERKAKLVEERASLEGSIRSLERERDVLQQEASNKQALVTKLEQQLATSDELAKEMRVLDQLTKVTEAFMSELRRARVEALAMRTSEMMRKLVHKEELVHSVEIDAETFGIKIFDRRGDEILNPSAGEREVFALSLLWGLARISQRALPVIIDTPLGRLDQMHRSNFVRHFLPAAGEQVIVLSTDSEIDERWYQVLQPHIAQETVIEFSDERQSSELRAGGYLDLLEAGSGGSK